MESTILQAIILGILGGLTRALVGLVKYFEKNKQNQKVRFWYLTFSLLVAALVGGVAGVLSGNDWRLAIIAGYAGTDFLESIYKIKKKQGLEI